MKKLLPFLLFNLLFIIAQAQIPSYVPTNGLLAWYPFNGNANDGSGNGHNGMVNGASLTIDRSSINNNAYYFNPTNHSYIKTNAIATSIYNNFTTSVWVNSNNEIILPSEGSQSNSSNQCVIHPTHGSCFGDYNINSGSGLYVGTNGIVVSEHSHLYVRAALVYSGNINGWHLITIVYVNKQPQLYIDGNFIKSGIADTRNVHPSMGFDNTGFGDYSHSGFGAGFNNSQNSSPQFFNGSIDDIAIYNRALTQAEITQLYTGTIPYADVISTNYSTICKGNSITLSAKETLPVTDIDGNTYPTVKIGSQIWTAKNLNVSKYRNGDIIPQVTDPTQWSNLTTGAWCYYNNDPANGNTYGKLYNWYAVNDPRGLALEGWHIPTELEWTNLINYLGGEFNAGGKMKNISGWNNPNTNATNISGFSGLPGGYRVYHGPFSNIEDFGGWWSASQYGTLPLYFQLYYGNGQINNSAYFKTAGLSVRVLRDIDYLNLNYLWSNGATTQLINVSPLVTTTYYCTVNDGLINYRDSVTVYVNNPNIFTQDTIKICGSSYIIDAGSGYSSYSWNTGATTQTINVNNSGWYKCTVYNGTCTATDSVFVSILNANIVNNDTTICRGSSITLNTNKSSSITDIDGIVYPTVKIGSQNWTAKNLNVSKYRNGDIIPQVTSSTQWVSSTTGAWCWYNNDSATYGATYGKLYNWYAVNDPRGLAPDGWHVPSDGEWTLLIDNLGSTAGTMMKTSSGWGYNGNGTNTSGFSGLPSGGRDDNGPFSGMGGSGPWWTSTEFNINQAWARTLFYFSTEVYKSYYTKISGYSVRLIKNNIDYLWSNGSNTSSIIVSPTQNTTYYCTVSNGINSCKDSVKVTVNSINSNFISQDTIKICGSSYIIDAGAGYSSYSWNTGATTQTINVTSSGWYKCNVNNGTCSATDSVFVSILNANIVNNDTIVCSGSSLTLYTNVNVSSIWQQVVSGDCYKLIPGNLNTLFIARRTDVLRSINNGNIYQSANWPLGIVRSGTSLFPGGTFSDFLGGQLVLTTIDNGYYYSYDNGNTFSQSGPTGFGTGGNGVLSLKNGRVIASNGGFLRGVYKSSGTNNNIWSNKFSGVDSYDFTKFNDDTLFAATSNYLLRSIDQGESWSIQRNQFVTDVEAMKDSLIWTDNIGNIFISHKNQTNLGTISARANISGNWVGDIRYDSVNNIIYITNSSLGLFFSENNGYSWSQVTFPGVTQYYNITLYQGSLFIGTNNGLYSKLTNNISSCLWSTGNTTANITVSPTQTTTYYCTVSNGINTCKDSVIITVNNIDSNFISQDTIKICGSSYTLDAGTGYSSYSWNTGSTTQSINVTSSGWYKCTVNNGTCSATDSVFVSLLNANIVNNDTAICRGSSITLNTNESQSTLSNGLVAYYPFNGNANDESGNVNNGTVNGATLTTDRFGRSGKAYSFDGSNFIQIADNDSLDLINDFSISSWFNANSFPGNSFGGPINIILCKRSSTPSSIVDGFGGYGVWESNGYHLLSTQSYPNAGPQNYSNPSFSLFTNNWYNYIVTYNDFTDSLKYFLNGSLIFNEKVEFDIQNNSYSMYIGALGSTPSYFWNGKIDDVAIYNRVLSQSEIQQLYNNQGTLIYQWSNGANTPTIIVSPTQTTTYYCTISNGINTCKDSVTVTVSNLNVNLFANDTIKVCSSVNTLDAGAGYSSYSWNTGATSRTINAVSSGWYKCTVTNSDGCNSTDSIFVSLNNTPPTAGSLSGTQSICMNGSSTFASTISGGLWSSGNTAVATVDSLTGAISPIAAGTATITYIIKGSNGCADATANRTIQINNIASSEFSDTSCNSYTLPWSSVAESSGDYTYTYQAANGCDSLVTAHITIDPNINSTTTIDTTACGEFNLPWGTIVASSGIFSNTYSTVNGCDSIVTFNLTIKSNPTVNISSSTTILSCINTSITATASGQGTGITYIWSNGLGASNVATITSAGTYTVTVNSSNGCSAFDEIDITLDTASLPSAPSLITSTNNPICGISGSATLSVTTPTGITIDWYNAAEGGTKLQTGSAAGLNRYVTPNISSTRTYYAEARKLTGVFGAGCVSDTRTPIEVVVGSIPASPSTTNGSRCGSGSVTVSALASSGMAIDWYSAANSGTLLRSNSSTFDSVINITLTGVTKTFYATAKNPTTGCVSSTRTAAIAYYKTNVSAPASIAITPLITNVCGSRVYRYTAPPLPSATATATEATGYEWLLTGTLGANGTITTGTTTSQVIEVTYTSNAAAGTGDSIKLRYTSACGYSSYRATKLTNAVLSVPAVPASITITPVLTNVCSGKLYRYTAPALPIATTSATAANGYEWTFTGSLGANATIDSGNLNSKVILVRFTANSASVTGDSIKLRYNSACGTSVWKASKLSNVATTLPAAPASILITPITINNCGAKKYRYTAPALPAATSNTATIATATGWVWSFKGTLSGNPFLDTTNAVVDSGNVNSRIIVVRYKTNVSASTGDSVKVSYTSTCGNSNARAVKLNNTALPVPTAPASISISLVSDVCGARVYRYTAPALPTPTTTQAAATGYEWVFKGTLGSNGVLDSGTLNSRIVRIKYSMNSAATSTDSAKVRYNSSCGYSLYRGVKLSNAAKVCFVLGKEIISKINQQQNGLEEMQVKVFPNPTHDYFNLQINTLNHLPVDVSIIDAQGKLIKRLSAKPNETSSIGNDLLSGIYLIKVVQGNQMKTVKVVKE